MNIGLVLPGPTDPTSFYRAGGPFGHMSRTHGVQLITGEWWAWDKIIQCDVLFLQRPVTKQHLTVCQTAKEISVPIWIDYDDLLFALRPSNPSYHHYMNAEAHGLMKAMIEMANRVTVTTQALAEFIRGASVMPNAFDDFAFTMASGDRKKRVSWRGSHSHHEDMEPFIPALLNISSAPCWSDWEWHFIGYPHWGIERLPKERVFWHEYTLSIFDYFAGMKKLCPAIHIVTLADNPFNRAKSNLAWIEAAAAGAVVIAPNWEQWHKPGVLNYNSKEDFETVLAGAMDMTEAQRIGMVSDAQFYIKNNLTLSKINEEKRMPMLEELRALREGVC